MNLVTLNLSENKINVVEGLSKLENLKTLHLANNLLQSGEDIKHLEECISLTNLDVSCNQLQGAYSLSLALSLSLSLLLLFFLSLLPNVYIFNG